ncbi:MAG: hypothetical protein M1836_005219 [Candelina mexicana]|nr:MAG: hypothetical protein M1836_005219 [Candelina mexicana]
MVYDWDGKEDVCYKMYIEDKKSLEEIMDYMKDTYNFAPRYSRLLFHGTQHFTGKRAFQTQFKRWEFPSKQNPAHKNAPLVGRVKELWERNTSQREMLRILNEEDGFDIKERELMRVRAKNRWLLRVPNGMKSQSQNPLATMQNDTHLPDATMQELEQVLFAQEKRQDMLEQEPPREIMVPRQPSPALSPEVVAKRKDRLEKLQVESAERWASRKRRRRTRGWAGLPADPPGPPRFPSETTIDESKNFLSLDAQLYRETRDHFQRICEELGFIKKTIAGPEKWSAAKNRLIAESPHLQSVFWGNNTQLDAKALALDVVCTDVTKRMRTLERRMTIAEAKNALGINPEESRQVREAFYRTLKDDHFTSKLEAGDDHWKELKAQWIQGSDLLQRILAPGAADPHHEYKVKAMEVLCRDVMKRLRDDQTKRDPSRKKQYYQGRTSNSNTANNAHNSAAVAVMVGDSKRAAAEPQQPDHGDLQIDPSLLLAANDPSLIAMSQEQQQQQQDQQRQQAYASAAAFAAYPPPPISIPAFFRLSPLSQLHQQANFQKVWLGTLTSGSVAELRQLATSKYPNTAVVRIEGMVKDVQGNEMSFEIDEDDELDAYLAHINGAKATFVFQLTDGYA